ncbi:hypothetical protein Tco_0837849 [Tanacetum coccineum]
MGRGRGRRKYLCETSLKRPRADVNVADLSTEDKLLLRTAKEAFKELFSARKTEALEIFEAITDFKA